MLRTLLFTVLFFHALPLLAAQCGTQGVAVQVLGSGGPELGDGRASSSYLLWVDGKARLLVDTGSGSALNFEKSGADFRDLSAILYSHFHVDHSAALPAYIKGSYFLHRTSDLPVYGPAGNEWMPGTRAFLQALFAQPAGAYHYLSDFLPAGDGSYQLQAHELPVEERTPLPTQTLGTLRIQAIPVHHGPLPALAWRVEAQGRSIVFSGDMNGDYHTLPKLAHQADLLIAHNAIPEAASGVARKLHMPPSVIGQIAAQARVKRLLLSHRMRRTLGTEKATREQIRPFYTGPVQFADDLGCYPLP